jgi:hypothetical protein
MNKAAKELFARIRPCDMERPFASISYSHADGEHVWQDALTLQELGYNIWIDRTVNPTEPRSWNEKTAEVIAAYNCRVVLFYTSKHSVVSKACLHEILACESSDAKATHLRKAVPLVKIDVDPIQDIEQFERDVHQSIAPSAERTAMAHCLSTVMDHCFCSGNSTVRMLSRKDPRLEIDYYQKLEETLSEVQVRKASQDERFSSCFRLLADHSAHRYVLQELEYLADSCYDPYAALLLYYLYTTGLCGSQKPQEAAQHKDFASFQLSEDQWLPKARSCITSQAPEKAAALYLAHGLHFSDAGSFLEASKLLTPKKNPYFVKDCLSRAARLGDRKAPKLLEGLERYMSKK